MFALALHEWAQIPAVVLLAITLATVISVAARVKGLKETVAILNMANEGLRATNDEQARKMAQDREAFSAQLHAQDIECQKQIGALKGELGEVRGAVTFLQSNYVTDIISAAGVAFAAPHGPPTGDVPIVAGE